MTLQEALERLVAALEPEEVWLFGSWARGEARPDSDVDLLVVVPYEGDPKELALRGYRVLRGRDFPLDLLVYPRSLLKERLEEGSLLLQEIFQKGRCVYARGSGKVA
jgi:predicted nucleotidyltransferase